MSLTVYYLHFSQADRIVWLCEELSDQIPDFKYRLHVFPRGMEGSEGKQKLLSLHPSGTSPTIVDDTVDPPVIMTESQAIMHYIITFHGRGLFEPKPSVGPQAYSEYLYWMSFANGSFQAFVTTFMVADAVMAQAGDTIDIKQNFAYQATAPRVPNYLSQYNNRMAKSKYLAGDEFTAADMMNIYGLTCMRAFYPIDLTNYPHIMRWLRDVTSRPAYKRTMEKAEDGLLAMTMAKVPAISIPMALSHRSWRDMPEWAALAEEAA